MSDYNFAWSGPGAFSVGAQSGANAAVNALTGLEEGTYTLSVTSNNTSGCPPAALTYDFVVGKDTLEPVPTVEILAIDTYCAPNNDGTGIVKFFVEDDASGDPTVDAANYTITFYRGNSTAAGDELFAANGNEGTATRNIIGANDSITLAGLADGFYTVTIADATNPNGGCASTTTFQITEDLPTIDIQDADVEVIADSNCDGSTGNGIINIAGIRVNGVLNTNTDDYNFAWSGPASFTAIASTSGGGADTLTDLSNGTYILTVTSNNGTGCPPTAITLEFVVEDESVEPKITNTARTADTFCDNGSNDDQGDGSLTVVMREDGDTITAAEINADYIVEWYRGSYTSVPGSGDANFIADKNTAPGANSGNANAGSAKIGTNIFNLAGLAGGKYTVFLQKQSGSANVGCSQTAIFEVLKDSALITINPNTDITFDHNFNCDAPNGFIQITNVKEDSSSLYALSNYTFTWYKDGVALSDPADGKISSLSGVNDRLDSLSAGVYTATATNDSTGCVSKTEVSIEIEDEPINPVIRSIAKTATTFCDDSGNSGNGSLEIRITEAGAAAILTDYTITWYRDSVVTAANEIYPNNPSSLRGTARNQSGDLTLLDSLKKGYYTVVIQKNNAPSPNAGCIAQRTFEVIEDLDFPTINIPDAQITHNTLCGATGNGALTIDDNDITFQGASGSVANYNWSITSAGANPTITQTLNTPATISFSSLLPDTISFIATSITTGCASGSLSVIILDKHVDPVIDSLVMTPNDNCNSGSIAQGRIDLLSIDGVSLPSNNYTYQWYVGTSVSVGQELSTILPGQKDDSTIVENLPDDNYTVEITNVITGCSSSQVIEVENDPTYPIIGSYEVNKDLTCGIGNGSFVLLSIFNDGTEYEMSIPADSLEIVTNYTLNFYESDKTTAISDSDPSTPMTLENLSMGYFFVSISRNDSNCESQLVGFGIENAPFYPKLQLAQIEADSTCSQTGTTPSGSLLVTVDNANDRALIDSTYTFNWYSIDPNDDNTRLLSGASISTNDTLVDQYAGRFEVEVTNTSLGCTSNTFFTLTNEPETIRIVSIDSVSVTTCDPSDAFFEVTQMNIAQLTDYTFNFYNGDPTLGNANDSLIYSGSSPRVSFDSTGFSVIPDVYYVSATSNITGCITDYVRIELFDQTDLPLIAIEDFTLQTNCDPSNPNGTLTVSADGSQDNTLYTFEWTNSAGVVVEANNATADSLAEDTYTVTVTEVSSNCSISEQYTMVPGYTNPFLVSITSEGNSNCVNPNGILAATVIDIPKGKSLANYNFYWFAGVDTTGVPDITTAIGTGSVIDSLDAGVYTIYVIDGTDAFCTSKAQLATVRDLIDPIDMRVDIINDVTICYPTLPNGRATIGFIEGDLFRYTFDWYEGVVTDTTGQVPFKSGASFSVDSLAVGAYTVKATDLVTGCIVLKQFNMLDATVTVGAPSVEKLSDRDNCLSPNGEAIARVNGNTEGYIFNWYAPDDLVNPAFTGDRVNTLDSVTYLVEAIKISTGCESARVAIEIGQAFEDPEFKVSTTGSICIRSSDGAFNQFNGTADIFFERHHVIDSIAWINPEGDLISNYEKLIDAEPGVWTVWFRSDNGCDYTREFEITTSLKIYNGLSANGDGINDYLIIDCIDYFPNNRVSIYNRDGSLVYETKGYTNETDHRFDGFSNIGNKPKQLPVGTYFYFIDKGDGSDVVQGYLELVR